MQTKVTLSEAIAHYLGTLGDEERPQAQQELARFTRWYGRGEAPCASLTPSDIEGFVGHLGLTGAGAARLDVVKAFLAFLEERGYTQTKLATHLRPPRGRRGAPAASSRRANGDGPALTREGYEQLVARLQALEEERVQLAQEIQRAAADKDFRENAPLHAARERAGFLEGEIAELREALRHAVVMDAAAPAPAPEQRVRLGRRVTLRELASGSKVVYTLVDTREANPLEGKISPASPIGRALLDRAAGEEVAVQVPRGTLRYVIERVES